MTIDLWMLVATAVLSMLIPGIYLVGRLQTPGGMEWALGNRDSQIAAPAFAGRAIRAHANLTENLAVFAILVLVAHVSGRANHLTAIGAQMFFAARVAHFAVYTAGVPMVRTVVFFVGVAGELLILSQLL